MLRHIIDKEEIRTDSAKVEAITKFKQLSNRTEMCAFLGLTSYYRQYIKNFASIAEPLYATLKKAYDSTKIKGERDSPEWNAFVTLKKALATAPVLAKPNWEQLFKLYTDASAIGVGAILSQDDTNGQERVICYASRGT